MDNRKINNELDKKNIRKVVYKVVSDSNGILRLKPAWVARDFLISGRNLGLKEEDYNVGIRGEICERWIGSTTIASNKFGPKDEGLSYLLLGDNSSISLKDAIETSKDLLMGSDYAKTHNTLGRLIKIFNYGKRLFFHLHQMKKDAVLVGCNGKEEAYYFPEDSDIGSQPETFFGVHPFIAEQKKYDILLPYLIEWNSDRILRHSRAYLQVTGDGFHLPAGIPHAPGTAMTLELQEESDVFANLQALLNGRILSKDTLFKDIRNEDKERFGEKVILGQIDWEESGDPYFFENRHTPPILDKTSNQQGGEDYWIFYNTQKFSGKKLIIKPKNSYTSIDKGIYTVLVWKGKGNFDEHLIEANNFSCDELIVVHDRAIKPLKIVNTCNEDLVIFKFYGKDINVDIPMLPHYK